MLQGPDRVKANLLGRSLALGLIAAQVAGLLHVALAPHQICREHGELLEPGPASASSLSGADVDVAPTGSVRAASDEAQWVGQAHEHCAVALRHREEAPASKRALMPVAVAATEAPRLDVGQPPPARLVVWQVAPKQGPPAA